MLRAAVTVAAAVRRLPRRGAVEVFARDYLSPPLLRALEAYREHFGHVRVPQSFEVPEGDPGWPIEVQGMNLGEGSIFETEEERPNYAKQ